MSLFSTPKQQSQLSTHLPAEYTGKLSDALRRVGKLQSLSRKGWETEFSRLVLDRGEVLVGKVLDWYILHMNDEFIPVAHSAKTFRSKFDAILKQYEQDPASTTISEEAMDVVNALRASGFRFKGKHGVTVLYTLVQKSLDNYKKFWAQCGVRKDLPSEDVRLYGHLIGKSVLCSPHWFVRNWFLDVIDEQDWRTQNPLQWAVFHPKNELFLNYGRQIAEDYCGDGGRFDKLLTEILK